MKSTAIKTDKKLKDLQYGTSIYPKLLAAAKERISLRFIIIVIIYAGIEIAQASGLFTIKIRALMGVIEIGLSIFLSYNLGYLGMIICVISNAIATIKMLFLANQVTLKVFRVRGELSLYMYYFPDFEDIAKITESAPGLLFCLAATRIALIVACIMVGYTSEQGRKNIKRLEWLANIDGVTGVFNHRYFQTKLEEEITKADNSGSTLGMLMIDLDNFKRFNDNYGHKAGDILLAKTSEIFMDQTGDQDIVCRYGGDEFVILLPDANSERILTVIEHIRKAFDKLTNSEEVFAIPDKVTLSAGYSIYPELAESKDDLIMQADSALYRAKNMGRNNVKLYRDIFGEIKYFFDSDEKLFGGLRALLGTVSAKDRYTLGHSERVMDYGVMIAKAMGLGGERIRLIKIAALLHDIGKVEIPENVLNKSEPLTEEDINMLHKHPSYSVDILEPLSSIELLIDSIKHHHERFDGKGYPCGLKGNDIPLEARILCVADSFDAMLSDRPYRKGMEISEVIAELEKNSGTQFDPCIVQAFLSAINVNCVVKSKINNEKEQLIV
ncbi:bifunctional diguanylate cyclase/phosphohydrolase [Acetivibrio cellulolyticus]|uniref:bifunctional diguanylate cyclase/phosphohydrolase n=1 Tax=Acetivibrio cellulolyticus TaxID=35830 RepID=UPI0001E2F0CF|nr:diguanylate cyclase [Acetivibrio cellulolyticus]